MKQVRLKNGISVPAVGQGTWHVGDDPAKQNSEIEALRTGIENGMTLIDTAEMYGYGKSENVVGEAIRPYDRGSLYIVSKVLPQNAGRKNMRDSCEESLRRLGTDYLDLYLYHWRGSIPLSETVSCLQELKDIGLIREFGVSNFDTADMHELSELKYGENCIAVQDLYHIGSRGIEYSLLPYIRLNDIALMAYCPLANDLGGSRRKLFENDVLKEIAGNHRVTVQQIMLAWVIRDGNTIAIPKSSSKEHTLENCAAGDIELTAAELEMIDRAFPAPDMETPLDVN